MCGCVVSSLPTAPSSSSTSASISSACSPPTPTRTTHPTSDATVVFKALSGGDSGDYVGVDPDDLLPVDPRHAERVGSVQGPAGHVGRRFADVRRCGGWDRHSVAAVG